MGKSKKVKKSWKKEPRLHRAERIWRLVHIEGLSYIDAWRKAVPFTKAKRYNCGILAKRACDLFEDTYGEDLQRLLSAAGMGLPRVVKEISKSLNQKKVELYKGEIVRDEEGEIIHFDDNFIQHKGRELLAKIHGLEKMKMEHTILSSFHDIMKEADKEDADGDGSDAQPGQGKVQE